MNKLTAIGVRSARPKHAHRATEIAAGGGLYLVIQPNGNKSWTLRYRHQGRPRNLRLGDAAIDDASDGFTLAAARSRAAEARVTLERGIDPAERQAPARADRVEALVEQFIELHVRRKTRPGSARRTEGLFRNYVLPAWRGRMIGEIRRRDVIDLVDKAAAKRPIASNRLLAALSMFDGWLLSRDVIPVSFTRGVKRPTKEIARDRVLDNAELAALWRATAGTDPSLRAIRLMILTGARRSEVAHMTKSEIDSEAREWTIPAARAKNGLACTLPLSEQAWQVLTSVPPIAGTDLVFTYGRVPINNWDQLKQRLSAAAGIDPKSWRIHDLRRTTATGMQKLGTRIEVIEQALNHTGGSRAGVTGTYQKHDYRTEVGIALAAWGDRVEQLASGAPAKVLKLPRR
jgi:integrase